MKILYVNDFKNNIAGAEVHILQLSEMMKARGHQVLFFSSDSTSIPLKRSIFDKINAIFNIKYYFKFKHFIKENQPDIIHFHGIFNVLSPSIMLATGNIPVIMTIHNNQIISPVSLQSERNGKNCKEEFCTGCINCVGLVGMIYEKVKSPIHKMLLKEITLFISPSDYMAKGFRSKKIGKVEVIPNGMSLAGRHELTNDNVVLFVGRLIPEKGVQILLKAMKRAIEVISDLNLRVVGDGPMEKELEELAINLNISKNIDFMGKVDEIKIAAEYINCTAVVVPSIYNDNFPTVILEAMSFGRPVIGTRMGGIPELVDDNETGYIVPASDEVALADKLIYLFQHKKILQNFSKNAEIKSKKYSMDAYIDKMQAIYYSNSEI